MSRLFLPRTLEPALRRGAAEFPVVVLTGPRQTGKSTLLKHLFPERSFVDLENTVHRSLARKDPHLFLENLGPDGGIVDEIQYVPELLSAIKEDVDRFRDKPGRYILTGSQVFPLMQGLSQSLAGRAAIFELLGLSLKELGSLKPMTVSDAFQRIHRGFYPDPAVHQVSPGRYYAGYVATYLEKDVRQVQNVQDLSLFQSFLELMAARVGSPLNLNNVARLAGISFTTARRWVSVLESTRILYLLRPYSKNITRRVVKSPKPYFTDTGLLAHLLKYPDGPTLQNGPMAGALFENLMVTELLKKKFSGEDLFELYYYRDSNDNEIDLVIETARKRLLVEFKMGKTLRTEFAESFRQWDGADAGSVGFVVSFSDQKTALSRRCRALPWWDFLTDLDRLLKFP
jgi:predicted AAA+ superfamily ATPase